MSYYETQGQISYSTTNFGNTFLHLESLYFTCNIYYVQYNESIKKKAGTRIVPAS